MFRAWLAFLKWVTPIDGAFTPGKEPVQFAVNNPDARFSALICFEDAFAEEAREHVTPDTDFLVNLTNDGWFGNGPAAWQQAASAVFRAVENGVPLVRCTNNGLTCWIDAQGRLREIFSVAGNVFDAGFMTARHSLAAQRRTGPHVLQFARGLVWLELLRDEPLFVRGNHPAAAACPLRQCPVLGQRRRRSAAAAAWIRLRIEGLCDWPGWHGLCFDIFYECNTRFSGRGGGEGFCLCGPVTFVWTLRGRGSSFPLRTLPGLFWSPARPSLTAAKFPSCSGGL